MKKNGFTLAEVLITLAIIGVIAAISVPSLIQKTNQAELITAWKKNFAATSQALGQYTFEAGSIPKYANAMDYTTRISNYMKIIKICTIDDQEGVCWHAKNTWKFLNGVERNDTFNGQTIKSTSILNNGSLMWIDVLNMNCVANPSNYDNYNDACMTIGLDINGFKQPNTIGKDMFAGRVYSDGTFIPHSTSVSAGWACDSSNIGWACSSDYLYQK